MEILSSNFSVSSKGRTDILDITQEVQKAVFKSKFSKGCAIIFVSGSTAGLTTVEYEPGLVQDLRSAFQRVAPDDLDYAHHQTWGDDNGHSHVRASILGPSLTVPFNEGQLTLGTWQQIVLIDFDTRPRKRDLAVQLIGE